LAIVAGYFLRLPFFENFIFIANQRKDGRYEKSFWDITFLFFYICVFTALRASIMDYVLIPFAKYAQVPIKKYQRFAEQSWSCLYYTCAFSFGIVSIKKGQAKSKVIMLIIFLS
jgi:acyl-CoA-dependent ceramide synthase